MLEEKIKGIPRENLKIVWYKLNKARETDELYYNLRFLSRRYLDNIAIQTKEKN